MIMNIRENLLKIKETLPANVTLVAVSKIHPPEKIQEAYGAGQRIFGENRTQELARKKEVLPSDIQWHMIGHLQTNKVKYIAPFVSMIQSVDSQKLLEEINKEALKNNRVIDCLLEFHIATEESKFGFNMDEARSLLESESFRSMKNVRLCGVMGMATLTGDQEKVRIEFRNLAGIFKKLKTDYFPSMNYFREVSMGMSGDYPVAIEEGSTMVRLGSIIFGERKANTFV